MSLDSASSSWPAAAACDSVPLSGDTDLQVRWRFSAVLLLQCVAVCCSVLQRVLQSLAVCCSAVEP